MAKNWDHVASVLPRWGRCELLRELGGGYKNLAVLVRRDSEILVAKSNRRQEDAIRWVASVQKVADSVGIVAPVFVAAKDGRFLVDGVTVESYIDGEPASDVDRSEVGNLLRRIHKETRDYAQRPGFTASIALLDKTKGGDVDLDAMPEDVVQACRSTWEAVQTEAQSVIHGDLGKANVLKTFDGRFALIDWDESRVDVTLLDMVDLLDRNPGYPEITWAKGKRALEAWKVATSWSRAPEYARRRVKNIMPAIPDV